MRRRDFIRGLMAIGVGYAVADRLAFVQGFGRVFPGADVPPDGVLPWKIANPDVADVFAENFARLLANQDVAHLRSHRIHPGMIFAAARPTSRSETTE